MNRRHRAAAAAPPRMEDALCFAADLARVVDALPPHLLIVLWLRTQGWTYAQIAEPFGVSKTRAGQWGLRLRKRLAPLVAG